MVRRIGTWRDSLRRGRDAAIGCLLPGGFHLAPPLGQVDGYLYPHEAVFLYWLAREGPGEGVAVEIGSMRGRSTLCLAIGLRHRGSGRLFAVDPHLYGTEPELRENLEHFRELDRVELVTKRSPEAAAGWPHPIRLLFVDGDHRLEAVEADVRAWLPHLDPGGFLVLHDSTELSFFPGPRRVAEAILQDTSTFDARGRIASITWVRRRGGEAWIPPRYGAGLLDGMLKIRRRMSGGNSVESAQES